MLPSAISVRNRSNPRRRELRHSDASSTFEDYCWDRWGWNRRQADRQIEAASVASGVRIGRDSGHIGRDAAWLTVKWSLTACEVVIYRHRAVSLRPLKRLQLNVNSVTFPRHCRDGISRSRGSTLRRPAQALRVPLAPSVAPPPAIPPGYRTRHLVPGTGAMVSGL